MKQFREVLNQIEAVIDYKDDHLRLKEIWNNLSDAITEHEAKSKEAAVMLSDIEIENLAAKRWKRLNRQKPKMKEGKRQFAIRAFKAGYKAAFGKEGE